MAGPSETPYYVPPLVLSQAQQVYQHGVPVTEYYGDPELDSQRSRLGWSAPPLHETTAGSHGRAGDPPTNRAAAGGW